MADVQHIFKGSGAPLFNPSDSGHHYVDIAGKKAYLSVGNATPLDWVKVQDAGASIISVNGYTGPVIVLAKADVGLPNVDNTSDANKPVSTATSVALNLKTDKTTLINTTSPLSGGGDLSASRTLAIALATNATNGYLSSTDWNTFNAKQPTAFTPTVPGNWTAVPTTVQQAFDTLAEEFATPSGISRTIISISINTAAGSATKTDYVYLITGSPTLTLPTAVGNTNRYSVTNVGVGTPVVAFTGGQTANGSSTVSLTRANMSLDFVSNNANWIIE
jgi:hypothetical protein